MAHTGERQYLRRSPPNKESNQIMARFVARFRNYRHGIQNGRMMVLADGQQQELKPEIIAAFEPAQAVLTEDEIQFGIENLNHKGLPIDRDRNVAFSPRSRISGFDSEKYARERGYTDEEHDLIVQVLRDSRRNGIAFIELPTSGGSRLEKPWKTYEETPVKEVLKVAKAAGLDFADVLTYEKANRNDPTVVLLLEDAIANLPKEEKGEDEVVIEA